MRLFLISVFIFILIFLGMATLNGSLIMLAIPLVVYLGFALFYKPNEHNIIIERNIQPVRVNQGDFINVTLSVINEGGLQEEIFIEDDVPHPLNLAEGHSGYVIDIPRDEKIEFSYKLQGTRGIYKFDGIRVTTSDSFGLFPKRHFFKSRDEIVVLPSAPQLKRFAIHPKITKIYAGNVPSRFGGRGVEFFGVRDYTQGDALRQINWRVSARFPEALFSSVFQQEKIADIWLILDARMRSNIITQERSLFEHLVEITSAVSHSLLRAGNRVGLLIYGGFLDWTYLGSGKRQREKILHALAGARPGESLVFEKFENLPTRIFPPRSQIVLISPLQNEDFQFLLSTRARGYQVLCISPDVIEFERDTLERTEAGLLGIRLAEIERKQLLDSLRQSGIQVFSINPTQRVEHSLNNISRFMHSENRIFE